MKIENHKNIIKNKLGTGKEISFSVETSATAYQVLSDGLYKNKIGSMIRELISNACDAQRAKGNETTPIKIVLPTILSQTFIIRDFGIGMSEDEMKQVYTTYFNSTKSDDNIFKGGFGLGSKTPLCYNKEQFIVNSYYDGYKLSYMVYVDDTGIPKLKEISKTKTNEDTGLEVIIGVNEVDLILFQKELYNFLIWNDVKIDISENTNEDIDFSDKITFYDIYEGKNAFYYNVNEFEKIEYFKNNDNSKDIVILIDGIKYTVNVESILDSTYENIFIKNIDIINEKIKYYTGSYADKKLLLDIFNTYDTLSYILNYGITCLGFKFPIGILDLTASRENIALTHKTKNEILTTLIAFFASCYLKLVDICTKELSIEKVKEIKENSLPYYYTYHKVLSYEIQKQLILDGVADLSYQLSHITNGNCFFYKNKLILSSSEKFNDVLIPLNRCIIEETLKNINKGISVFCAKKISSWFDFGYHTVKGEIPEIKNIILSLSSPKSFSESISENMFADGYYIYIYCPTKKSLNKVKELIENAKLLKYNLYISETPLNMEKSYGKRKIQYHAYWYDKKNDSIYEELEKIDYIQKWIADGKEVYCLPVKTLTIEYPNINFLKLFYKFIPCDSLIVFVHQKKYPFFLEKYGKYDIKELLKQEKIVRVLRHIHENDINLYYETDRNFFLYKDFEDNKSYYKKEIKIKHTLLDSYKRWKYKLYEISTFLDNIYPKLQWNGIIYSLYVSGYYSKIDHNIKLNNCSYLFKTFKGEKLRVFLNLMLTNDCYLSYSDRVEFAKIINDLFKR